MPHAASAQRLLLPPDVEAHYPAQPKTGEMLVHTREGCGMFTPQPDAATVRTVPDMVTRITNNWKRYSWDGLCYEGLALGSGKLLIYNESGTFISSSATWVLRGRGIGRSWTTIQPSQTYGEDLVAVFNWKGTNYTRNVHDLTPIEPKGGRDYPASVSYTPPDPKMAVRFTLAGPLLQAPARIVQMSLTDKFQQTGSYFDRYTEHPCPKNGCGALWVEKAGPIIRGFDAFEGQHGAEINALQASLGPLLKILDTQREREQVTQVRAEITARDQGASNQAAEWAKAANQVPPSEAPARTRAGARGQWSAPPR
jgi:hypothetical protein